MRRIILIVLCVLIFCQTQTQAQPRQDLRLLIWPNILPPWVFDEFTRETGISLSVDFVSENRITYHTLRRPDLNPCYDLVMPSAPLAQRLMQEGLIRRLTRESIPEVDSIDPWFLERMQVHERPYAIPLIWGRLLMLIDRREIPKALADQITGFQDLWRPEFRGKILLPNEFRSLLSIALLADRKSVNAADSACLEQAVQSLRELVPAVRFFESVDQQRLLDTEGIGVAVVWSNKIFLKRDPLARYERVPAKEGSPLWLLSLAIPTRARQPKNAARFINFTLRPEIMARLCEDTGYAVTGVRAKNMLPAHIRDDASLYMGDASRTRFEIEQKMTEQIRPHERRWHRSKYGK